MEQLNALKRYGLRCIRCSIIGDIFWCKQMLFWSIRMEWMRCEWSVHLSVDLGLLNARYHFFACFIRVFIFFILLLSVSCDEPFISLCSSIIFLLQCIVIYFRRSPSRLSRFLSFLFKFIFCSICYAIQLCETISLFCRVFVSSFPFYLCILLCVLFFFLYRRQKYS